MDNELTRKMKTIDNEISNALNAVTELEKNLTDAATDSEGNLLREECIMLKEKFASFSSSMNNLTKMLVEMGILDKEEGK